MLELLKTYAGSPAAGLQHLVLPNETLILYPSADAVVILSACTLALVRVLAFEEVFPGTTRTKDKVACVSVDAGMKLVVASMNSRVAAWSLSGTTGETWRVHSSLIIPDSNPVTTLDCQSGLLAVGTKSGLSVYTLILDNDLPTWSQKWKTTVATPCLSRFSPSLMYIATTSIEDNLVRIYSTTSGRQTQKIPHPRPLTKIAWRRPSVSSRDDLILYTITSDATLRIFLPVLDAPQYLQLHASLDLFSSLPFSVASEFSTAQSSVFWLDRAIIGDSLAKNLTASRDDDDVRHRRAREIKEEGWDLFLRVLGNGSIVVTAVANIDRRPPTLLTQFTLQHTQPATLPHPPSFLYLFPNSDNTSITLVTSPPLATYELDPLSFFDDNPKGLVPLAQGPDRAPEEESRILRFIRTPEGRGVGVVRTDGGEVWQTPANGSNLLKRGRWPAADLAVVLQNGEQFATYSASELTLTLMSTPPATISIPELTTLFSLPSDGDDESIIGVTPDLSIVFVEVSIRPSPTLRLRSHNKLALSSPPKVIVPVDPMAWSGHKTRTEHDVLLSVSEEGELAFWVPEDEAQPDWRCTGKVRTGRTGFNMVRCSSAKKSVLVVPGPEGEELTIWDSKESEFASGMEYRTLFSASEPINDLDWTSTPDSQSILAVGFAHHIDLLCQQRLTYFDEDPAWGICWRISIGEYIPYSISDSIWLANGSLLVGAGHQMYLFGQPRNTPSESLFEYVARQNGPLDDFHPQILLQCLLWEKIELVKDIIVNLARDIKATRSGEQSISDWHKMPVEQFLRRDQTVKSNNVQPKLRYNFLFDGPEQKDESDENVFSRGLVLRLIEELEAQPLPHLTPNEHAHLLVLIQTTLEIDEQRRALDANGLRYLISMRSFYILNRRASSPTKTPSDNIPWKAGRRERLRYRDIIWAFHSESQDLLLTNSIAACDGKMGWSDARALGVFVWLNSIESIKSHMEVIARNEYLAGDNRDPSACSLFYFALGKAKLVHGLWRQAAWHKEQPIMLKFLSNDFTQARWRTAALKNAYALLSKRRFEYSAAFFLLGGSLKDAVNVCIRQLDDFQLAVALARVVEQSNDGPVLRDVITNSVLPIAFKDGNRWLGSWAFWLLHRRDLAVRILLTPLPDIAAALSISVTDIGEPHYDDPSLALLFSQLRSKTLQTAKGTSEISGRAEFNFVLQMARVFCRMGCHVLALDLVRSWSFERPSTIIRDTSESASARRPSASPSRHSLFAHNLRRRPSVMIDMDLPSAPPTRTASPERKATGTTPSSLATESIEEELKKDEGDLFARKAGLGSLMKSAKQDVKVEEFDMNAFGF
ncbi:hypothetical protein PLICRDRAFT_101217 [Plicaturopsis crispa FD-325 SS-3]|nr:hypothetical protein PLICRDRAFT_101217 [Plicaturopsis crispa FD-325 SS-3]